MPLLKGNIHFTELLVLMMASLAAVLVSDAEEEVERFKLFNCCRPVIPVVVLVDESSAIGLAEESLRAGAGSRPDKNT